MRTNLMHVLILVGILAILVGIWDIDTKTKKVDTLTIQRALDIIGHESSTKCSEYQDGKVSKDAEGNYYLSCY